MKERLFLFVMTLLLVNIASANGTKLEVISNISLEKTSCSETSRWIITSDKDGYMSFENEWYGILKKANVNKSSIKVFSSDGPLNFSIVDVEGRDRILFDNFRLRVGPNRLSYYGWYIERPNCFQFKKNWSLIRIPILYGLTSKKLIDFTLNIDKRLGYNEEGYIFLMGTPFPGAKYMDLSKAEILSDDPITINFESRIRDDSAWLATFIDLYYLPLPLLKIRQKDIINLENDNFDRNAYATNLHNRSVFYRNDGNKINIFYSDKTVVDGIEITS